MKTLLHIIIISLATICLNAQSTTAIMKVRVKIISGANVTLVTDAQENTIIISSSPNTEVMIESRNQGLSSNEGFNNSKLDQNNLLKSDLAKGTHKLSINSLMKESKMISRSSIDLITTTIEYL